MNPTPHAQVWWGIILLASLIIICSTISIIAIEVPNQIIITYDVRMDNNTLEAIKSINYTALSEKQCQPVEAKYNERKKTLWVNVTNNQNWTEIEENKQ